ncbi:hypothetical protein QQS21_009718 [Conoideocrella luteorostrata]|uniref:Amidase domain-containing protein n=1 Tax=Conoideocrella luteorostrata TaxID=1105319 RepID=A0AAJ0FVD6_9HYPO|nr:hypothetical protein QQS21_009718 [Conoideocrella luteorostrata]
MARPQRSQYAQILFITALSLLCFGFFGWRMLPEVDSPIQSPPSVISIGQVTYFISPSAKHKTHWHSKGLSPSGPCSVIRVSGPRLTPEHLIKTRQNFSQDDVWTSEFLHNIIFQSQGSHQAVQISTAAQKTLNNWGSRILSVAGTEGSDSPPPGPYFCNAGQLHEVYRLYTDTAEAFMSATIQSSDDPHSYNSLNMPVLAGEYPGTLTIAVPSRLYFMPTEEKPLAGLRIAVKDTQNVRGVKTTGSSRAWSRLYGPQGESATGVQRLLDHGAIVVGKLKSTQFGESEWATSDWVDYHAPWNPRGDGYQTPSASSSGSAVGVAAYDWLDLATGTDFKDEASSAIFENTIQTLESTLGITRTILSLRNLWSETNTVGTKLSIDDYFKTTFPTASSLDQWSMLTKFQAEYKSAFGHTPPLNPQLQWKMWVTSLSFNEFVNDFLLMAPKEVFTYTNG